MKRTYSGDKILCGNDECSSRNRPKSVPVGDDLLLIGTSYKCYYCRGDKFIIVKEVKNV